MQNIKVIPTALLRGEVRIPGDKSISHRAVILASIAEGVTCIDNFLMSEDCLATMHAMQAMGVKISHIENRLEVHGVGLHGLKAPKEVLDLGNSGTAIRLLAGLLAAQTFDTELIGDASLLKRPMARVVEPLRLMGAKIQMSAHGTAPLKIQGGQNLKSIEYTLPIASAQVKSALMLAGLYAEAGVKIHELIPTRDHTERMLSLFKFEHGYFQQNLEIPSDISSAAFFIVAATINPNSDIVLKNIGVNPYRTGIITLLRMMGADIKITNQGLLHNEPVADLRIPSAQLRGIEVPSDLVAAAIDEFPIFFIAAACANGTTLVKNAQELRFKESDRIQIMAEGLQKLGIAVQTFADGLRIEGGSFAGGQINSHGDHRVAMAFAIAGTVAKKPVIIENCSNIATSFPDFITQAQQIGMSIEYCK